MIKPKYKIGQTVWGFEGGVCNRSGLFCGKINLILKQDNCTSNFVYKLENCTHSISENNIRLNQKDAEKSFKKEFKWLSE